MKKSIQFAGVLLCACIIFGIGTERVFARLTGTAPTNDDVVCWGPAAAEDCVDASGNIIPTTTAAQDLGTSSLKWRDLQLSRNASIGGTLAVTGAVTQTGAQSFNGNVTIGDDNADFLDLNASTLTVNAQINAVRISTGTGVGGTTILSIDGANYRVGIGNIAPATALDVTGVVTTSSLTITDTMILSSRTKAQFDNEIGVVGQLRLCSNCTVAYALCVGSGTAKSGYRQVHSATLGCGSNE